MLTRTLAAAALLTLTLAGCSSESGSTAIDPGADAPSEVTSETTSEAASGGVTCDYLTDATAPAAKPVDPPPPTAAYSGAVNAVIGTTIGDLPVVLDADKAPCTVNSLLSLADQGYFDDVVCHRMTTEGIFVLQCGDPTGTGSGGPGYSFGDELDGQETYGAGTLAMANAGEDTNGSQFFVVYADTQLSPDYTVFGQIDPSGVKLVKKLAKHGTDNANGTGDGHPMESVALTGITVN